MDIASHSSPNSFKHLSTPILSMPLLHILPDAVSYFGLHYVTTMNDDEMIMVVVIKMRTL